MIVLILIALLAFLIGGWFFLRAMYLLALAGYYKWFASERKIDRKLQRIWSNSLDYESFQKKADNQINDIVNGGNR